MVVVINTKSYKLELLDLKQFNKKLMKLEEEIKKYGVKINVGKQNLQELIIVRKQWSRQATTKSWKVPIFEKNAHRGVSL